jgi:hypothetical protein
MSQTWTLVGAGLAVIGALTTAFMGPRIGIPLLLCGAFCGSVPFIIDSPWFRVHRRRRRSWSAAGLGLWWLADKVRDSVNANPRKDAEVNPAQSPHDDVPPQA